MEHTRDPNRVYIFDTTNRDGEQATKGPRNGIESKLEIAHALAGANFDRIEAGFPGSSILDFRAVKRTAGEVKGPMIFALAKAPLQAKGTGYYDINKAYEAVQDAQHRGIHVFTILFDPRSLEAYGVTRKQVVEDAVSGVAHARKLLGSNGQVEFSFQNATNCPLESIVDGYKRMAEAGADVINVPDTIGYSHPHEITKVIRTLRKELSENAMVSIHCHDDLGLATANSLAAVMAGADIVEGTINGIGERAGNAPIEEVVMNIITRKDKFNGRTVGIKTEMLNPLSKLVSDHYDMPVQPNKAIVGGNAFSHRAGLHQGGMVKDGLYGIIDPNSVGWDGESYGLTARSGWSGVAFRLQRLGYHPQKDLKEMFMPLFKALADEKRTIDDVDLVCLMNLAGKKSYRSIAEGVNADEADFAWFVNTVNKCGEDDLCKLVDMEISKRKGRDVYFANVTLEFNGRRVSSGNVESSNGPNNNLNGNGPAQPYGAIDALFRAVDKAYKMFIDSQMYLVSYNPINAGIGSNAIAEVTVILNNKQEFNGQIRPLDGMIIGRAYHVDTLKASVLAYVNALNNTIKPF